MDIATFRADFPEFADASKYPDAQVTFYLNLGVLRLDACRWAELLPYGLELFMAHNLALASKRSLEAAVGGVPGQLNGPINSKAVDKVSYGMDPALVTLTNGGFWNLTAYGVEFLQLARMIGAGPIQVI